MPLPAGVGPILIKGAEHLVSQPAPPPTIFLPEIKSANYTEYRQKVTKGKITPLINGRNSNGNNPDIDLSEPLDEMESLIRSLKKDDLIYLSAWFFEPATPLTSGVAYKGVLDWGNFLAEKAAEGVVIRIICNDFDVISKLDQWLQVDSLDPLELIVSVMDTKVQKNLKYCVSMHETHVGQILSTAIGSPNSKTHIASHHQKFMIVKKSGKLTAFCGGLDIESRKAPANWSYTNPDKLTGWHDIHFKIEGPLAYDLEKEFVLRWNREKGTSAKNPSFPDWKGYETLKVSPLNAKDNTAAKKVHESQMLRTISIDGGSAILDNKSDDIIKGYKRIISLSKEYLYMENQYFRDQELANALVAKAKADSKIKIILVVVANAAADDGKNAITLHGDALQHLFFTKVENAFKSRFRLYTMVERAVHSKLFIADDRWINGGSANANTRSFKLDSELNIAIDDKALTKSFKERLWAHNLGTTSAKVASFTDIHKEWDDVAKKNEAESDFTKHQGEGIIPFDYKTRKGSRNLLIPDYLAYMDFDDIEDGRGEVTQKTFNA